MDDLNQVVEFISTNKRQLAVSSTVAATFLYLAILFKLAPVLWGPLNGRWLSRQSKRFLLAVLLTLIALNISGLVLSIVVLIQM